MNPETENTFDLDDHNGVAYRRPRATDGLRMWEIARDSQVLDVNSSYAYVLWAAEFTDTSIIAEVDGRPVGFVTGYRRPHADDALMVWQVAVDADQRGKAIAGTMLCELFKRCAPSGVTAIHTTISPDNAASQRLFAGAARSLGLDFTRESFFEAELFGDSHEPEDLYRLEPMSIR
ncbi:diaminobutyrate acetyltransferase [Gordonia humi]|uniref:L-2,4-diaminobutyric acid acetyltransferase n=2 Tax=Gordonia humi TaxID=686429 RepID=A0A840F060_9ACTN|nr:L-2,4-diaminobutyric acid acetyltransferase [Gordonia humi]